MKKSTGLIIGAVGGGLALGTVGLMYGLSDFVWSVKRQTLEEAMKWQTDHYDTSFYGPLEKQYYEVESEDGYILHIEFLRNPVPTTKYMILTHGYSDNRMGSLKYVSMYMRLGFNCIIYDLRGHGENTPHFVTCGILEASDLNCLIRDTHQRYPDLTELGLHGESLGAATTATCMKYKPDVDFAVADCGFSDIENVLRGQAKAGHMPGFFVNLADAGSRIRFGYAMKDMRPILSLSENEIPILFIHGEDDAFITPDNSRRMYECTKGKRELRLIPGAQHAESILKSPDLYEAYVREFLQSL